MDNVVFDIGNVLVRWDPRSLYRNMGYSEAAMQAIMAETGLPEINHRQLDAGAQFGPTLARLAGKFPAHAEFITAFDVRWPEMLGDAIAENVALFQGLKAAGTPVYGLTNFNREKFDIARARHPFLDEFDGLVVSGDIGMVKPDRDIYQALIEQYALDPRRSLFIDDSAANIDAARELGFDVILYTEGEFDLAAEFRSRRL